MHAMDKTTLVNAIRMQLSVIQWDVDNFFFKEEEQVNYYVKWDVFLI